MACNVCLYAWACNGVEYRVSCVDAESSPDLEASLLLAAMVAEE